MMLKTSLLLSACAFFTIITDSPRVMAQQSNEQAQPLEELVVTARKREEKLMEVPVAITAMTSKDLEAKGLETITDIALFTPSFYMIKQNPGSLGANSRTYSSLTFRGLVLANNFNLYAGGSLFIDGASVIGAEAPSNSDIARVEILKGPQSAYFGRSTFIGAINYVTRDPGNDFKGHVSAEYSSYNSNEETASIEGAIVPDKLTARIGGRHWELGGMYDNATNPSQKLGEEETDSISSTIVLTPTDQLKIKGFVNWFTDMDGPPAEAALKSGELNCSFNGGRGNYYCGSLPNINQINPNDISGYYVINRFVQNQILSNTLNKPVIYDTNFLDQFGLRRVAVQTHLKADYETSDGYVFSSLTAYHRDQRASFTSPYFRDTSNIPSPFAPNPANPPDFIAASLLQDLVYDYSQEFRVTSPIDERFRWTLGANYLYGFTPGGPVIGFTPQGPTQSQITQREAKTPAIFGAGYFDIIEGLTLSVEGRVQWDHIVQFPKIGSNGLPLTGILATDLHALYRSFSPRISLDYKYSDNSTVYALYSSGFRPGGFNAALVSATPAAQAQVAAFGGGVAYGQEEIDNYEAGIKSTFLDGRARTTLSIYYDRWIDGQVSNQISFLNPDGSPNTLNAVVNNGLIDLTGFEFEGNFKATEHLTLSTTAALNNSDVKQLICADCKAVYNSYDASGHQVPGPSRWNWTGSAEYTDHLFSDYEWYGRADWVHKGRYYVDYSNVAWVDASDTVNLRLGARNDSLSIEAFVLNATQNTVPVGAELAVDSLTVFGANKNEIRLAPPDKRRFGFRIAKEF